MKSPATLDFLISPATLDFLISPAVATAGRDRKKRRKNIIELNAEIRESSKCPCKWATLVYQRKGRHD